MAQTACVIVSTAGREQLAAIAADRNRLRKHVEQARIVLASADRASAQLIAQSVGVSRPTVWRWQQRFAESGVEGLLRDKTRKPGKAPLAAETMARVVALTCSEPPHQATHWTVRAMEVKRQAIGTPDRHGKGTPPALGQAVPIANRRAPRASRVGGVCLPTGASRGGTHARCLKRQLSLPVSMIPQ
jgi:transposase